MTPMLRTLVACAALLLAACNNSAAFQAGNVTVSDESGLVTAAREVEAPAVTTPGAAAGDSLTQVVVSWPGDSCVENWLVRLSGNALQLSIEPGTRLTTCSGAPAYHAVVLSLNRVVDAAAIDVTLSGNR